ncbi:MAG: PEP-CTERM sorting domain-containing protein [Phycisphaerae bacterium]|nr:PEP-CTERM sorting domain-containing protein [Phycisphaerae bacterium]NUQ45036.1 PEP-CTERM sorting domain-containing protein [Phycisphaerae bacterium]
MRKGMCVVLGLTLAFTVSAQAQVWDELADGGGDAGDVLPLQQTPGPPDVPLVAITGTIDSSTDVDCYSIFIPAPTAFFATTVGTPGTLSDTQLFLFDKRLDPTGAGPLGIIMNDDHPGGGTLRSTLTGGVGVSGPEDFGSVPAPGSYMLCVTGFNRDPVSPGGTIWAPGSVGGSFAWESEPIGPYAGPGAPGPHIGWTGSTGTGTYFIELGGVATKPEPGTLSLLALGGLALLRRRRS